MKLYFMVMDESGLKNIVKYLPKSPKIIGRNLYFNYAVIVPLMLIDGEYNFLFEKRVPCIDQGGDVCFPGGRFDSEKDTNFQETAVRETVEELGIRENKINIKGELGVILSPMGFVINSFLATLEVKSINDLSPKKDEVGEVFTIPVACFEKQTALQYHVRVEMQPSYTNKKGETIVLLPSKELGLPEIYHHSWGGKKYRVFVYKTTKGVIWGITAELIHEIINIVQKIE